MPPLTLDYGTTPPNQKSVLVWILRSVLAIVLLLFLSWFIVWFFDLRPRDTDGLVDAYRLAPMLADYQKQHGVLPNSKGAIKFRSRFEWKYTNQPKTELQIIAFTRSGYDYRRIVYIDTAFEIHGVGGNWLKENIKDIEAGSTPIN